MADPGGNEGDDLAQRAGQSIVDICNAVTREHVAGLGKQFAQALQEESARRAADIARLERDLKRDLKVRRRRFAARCCERLADVFSAGLVLVMLLALLVLAGHLARAGVYSAGVACAGGPSSDRACGAERCAVVCVVPCRCGARAAAADEPQS